MKTITFAPGGNSDSFKNKKFPEDLPEYLSSFNLSGFEIECGRGVRFSEKTKKFLPSIIKENNITLSLHAPYFISLSGKVPETRLKSIEYIRESAKFTLLFGGRKIVVHSGSLSGMTREEALSLASDTLYKARKDLISCGYEEVIICPETMGKINQLGNLFEVLTLCKVDSSFLPCIDFGHLNARTHGGIKSYLDYEKIFDECERQLGFERTSNMHIHFSKILYTEGGEKKHLCFSDDIDNKWGPDYKPLMEIIKKRSYTPSIVCESQGTQAEDAYTMLKYFLSL